MNYYEQIIAKATGLEPGPDMDEVIFVMDCRFGDMTKAQIAKEARSAWEDVQAVREMAR